MPNIHPESEAASLANSVATAEQLLARAESGEKLNIEDRRTCVAYLMFTQPHLTNGQIATKFSVSESQIRKDKGYVEETRAKETFETDAQLVVYRVIALLDQQVENLQKSLTKSSLGTRDYVFHCKIIAELGEKKLSLLRELGYVPDTIGAASTKTFDYAAIVTKGDQVETKSIDLFDDENVREIKAARKKHLESVENRTSPVAQPKREITYVPVPPNMPITIDIEHLNKESE